MLEMEGVVSKLHGSGNFYHQSTINLKMRLDLMPDYKDVLEDAGYKVTRDQSNFCFRMPDKRECNVFGIDREVLSFDLIYTADGDNAIFTKNIIPRQMLTVGLEEIQQDENIMELLARLHKEGLSIVMVTHEAEYARLARRTIEIEDGRIVH